MDKSIIVRSQTDRGRNALKRIYQHCKTLLDTIAVAFLRDSKVGKSSAALLQKNATPFLQ
ncbi:MAG: hypothetical protein JRD93_21820 [Deltaproteobacteria bacterium]|nr:hypothetical protein [Deltaproteobacteria bacterium]